MFWRKDLQDVVGKILEEEEEEEKAKLIQFLSHWVNCQWWLVFTEMVKAQGRHGGVENLPFGCLSNQCCQATSVGSQAWALTGDIVYE